MSLILETPIFKKHRKKLEKLKAQGVTFRCANKEETTELAEAFTAIAGLDNRPKDYNVLKIGFQAMRNAGKTTFIQGMVGVSGKEYKAEETLTKMYNIQSDTEHLGVVNSVDYAEGRNGELSPCGFAMMEDSLRDTFGDDYVDDNFLDDNQYLNPFEEALRQKNRAPGIDIIEHIDNVPDDELFPDIFIALECERDSSVKVGIGVAVAKSPRYVTIYCDDALRQTDGYQEFSDNTQHLRL